MSTPNRTRAPRRLGVVLASALAVGGLVALTTAPANAEQTGVVIAESGVATWGVSDLLGTARPGFPSPSATPYVEPATYDATTKLSTWEEGSGTVNGDGSATLTFKGASIHWATTGNAWLKLADLEATFDADGDGTVSALASYGTTVGGSWATATEVAPPTRLTIVDLASTDADPATYPDSLENLPFAFNNTASKFTWSGLTGRWSSDFLTFLAGSSGARPAYVYASTVTNGASSSGSTAGVLRWPAEFKFSIDRQVASTTSSAEVDDDGIVIMVEGEGFKKTFPGVYVSLRTRTAGDEDYDGSQSLPQETTPTAWVSNNAADVGPDPATGAAGFIDEDGSFSAPIHLTKAQAKALDVAGTYTIVTRKAHGQGGAPAHADQITEAPIDLGDAIAEVKARKSTTITAPAIAANLPDAALAKITVKTAAGVPATGSVTVKDGDTEVGTGTLNTNGIAKVSIPSTAAGPQSYSVVYGGDSGFWGSTGTVKVNVKGPVEIESTLTSGWTKADGGQLQVTVTDGSDGPVVPTGTVTLVLKNGSTTITKPAKALSDGVVEISLPKGVAKGEWSANAKYSGSKFHEAKNHKVTLTVS